MSRYTGALLGFGLGVGLALLAPQRAQAGSYTFTTLNNPGDPTFNQLLGINNAGTIAGYFGSGAAGHPNKGYTLTPPSTYTNENFPGSAQTQVIGINNTGVTVGFWSNTNNGIGLDSNFGFVDNHGVFTNVNDPATPSASPSFNNLLGVNDHNVAVGFYNDAAGNSHSYTYDIANGQFTPIPLVAASSLTASAINNSGEIAGYYTSAITGATLGFIDNNSNGIFTSVNAPGATFTQLFGLNNEGIAVGVATINNVTDGIVYNTLNDSFNIVNDPFASPGTTTINGINDAGEIVGFYTDAAGNTDGFLATPVPEPGSFALIGSGLLALGLVRLGQRPPSRRRRPVG